MDSWRIPLFPEGSLSASIVTTVWVGVWVVAFFNLRLGWTFSGLVVPGYVVPLLIAKPSAGAVVIVEGVVTYLIVLLLSEALARGGVWCSFFGRDRFFALVLASIVVRVSFDGWLLPWAGAAVNDYFQLEFDFRNDLHSFGLIIVALIANQFWKPGLWRGSWCLAVTVGVTYLLVRGVLMEFTNFNIGNLQYLYEDMASSLLAGPKAYIVLVTTAFVASWMNLHYNWEYNGILIPALLALQWYEPFKLLTSAVEAAAIYALAVVVLHTPFFRSRSFEAAHKVLLFFTLGFAYRMALGFLIPWWAPGAQVSDYFGFGYLLSTLLALKAHEKGIALRLSAATLQVSLVGAVAGSLLGFVLTLLPLDDAGADAAPGAAADMAGPPPARFLDMVGAEMTALRQQRSDAGDMLPEPHELEAFILGLGELLAYRREREPGRLERARARLGRVHFRVEEVQGYLCVRENRPERGWGLYVLNLDAGDATVVAVPGARAEWAVADAAALLFQELGGQGFALVGSTRRTHRAATQGSLTGAQNFFDVFLQTMGAGHTLLLRGRDGEESNSLWVNNALPQGFDLAGVRRSLGTYRIHWGPAPASSESSTGRAAAFAELWLSRDVRRSLRIRAAEDPRAQLQRTTGEVQRWLLDRSEFLALPGANAYVPAKLHELRCLDEEVLTPLLRVVQEQREAGALADAALAEVQAAAAVAHRFGYQLTLSRDQRTGAEFLILAEPTPPSPPLKGGEGGRGPGPRRAWGTYAFRLGAAQPYGIEVPRPLLEQNTFEYGIALFMRLRAQALFLSGAHPQANLDGSADLAAQRNKLSLLTLAGQAWQREGGSNPRMLVQSRAMGLEPGASWPQVDLVLGLADGTNTRMGLSELGKKLAAVLDEDRLTFRFADGSPETVGYEASGSARASYLAQGVHQELALLWLAPTVRLGYRRQIENRLQEAQFRAVKIPTREADLFDVLAAAGAGPPGGAAPAGVRRLVQHYVAQQDVVALRRLAEPTHGLRLERILDVTSQQAFLLLYSANSASPLVANLAPRSEAEGATVVSVGLSRERVQQFIDQRAAWLEYREAP